MIAAARWCGKSAGLAWLAARRTAASLPALSPLLFPLLFLGTPGCAAKAPSANHPPEEVSVPAPVSASEGPEIASLPCPRKKPPVEDVPQKARDGTAAYYAGLCPEALSLFEAIDAEGKADGVVLYRMAYCYASARSDEQTAQQTYERARAALAAKLDAGKGTLDDYFYLVNSLLNLNSGSEATDMAKRATQAIESCSIAVGDDGTSAFEVGKLYGDGGQHDREIPWYRRALALFEKEMNPPSPYVSRASRAVTSYQVNQANYKDALQGLEKLSAESPGNAEILINLAMARVLSGDFEGAEQALAKARPTAGNRIDDFSYLEGMIRKARRMAGSGHAIPDREPDGRTYPSLSKEELESRMKDASQSGMTLITAAPDEGSIVVELRGPRKKRVVTPAPDLLAKLDAGQARLLALSMEVIRRGLSLQETAFSGGMSPLVLHDWREQWMSSHREDGAPAAPVPAENVPQEKPPGPGSR